MKKALKHPNFILKGEDYSKSEILVVPNQSMSLHEILLRFTRKERLPVSHEHIYGDDIAEKGVPIGDLDLEKESRQDIFDMHQRAESIRDRIKLAREKQRKKLEEIEAAKKEKEKEVIPERKPVLDPPKEGDPVKD